MKKFVLMIFACGLIFTAYSQSAPGKWMIKKVGVSFGVDQDMVNNLNADFMINTGKNSEGSALRNMGLGTDDMYGGFCENPNIRAYMTLGLPGRDKFNIDVAANAIFNRYDGLYFRNYDSYGGCLYGCGFDYYGSNEYVNVQSVSSEVNIETVLNRKFRILPGVNFYTGAGINTGYIFGGDLQINGTSQNQADAGLNRTVNDIYTEDVEYTHHYESYKQRDAFTQRAIGTAGLSFTFFKRVEVGAHFTGGIGYRKHFGSGFRRVNLSSLAFRANWHFKQNAKKNCAKKCSGAKW